MVAQTVKDWPAVQETWVQPLGQGDPLEEGMAPHSSVLAWRIPRTEEPGGLQSMGSQSRTRLGAQAQRVSYSRCCAAESSTALYCDCTLMKKKKLRSSHRIKRLFSHREA